VIGLVDEGLAAYIDGQRDAVPARRWGGATWCRLGSEQIEWVESEADSAHLELSELVTAAVALGPPP
jgi:hypothetical protein